MSLSPGPEAFRFVVGGTLPPDSPSYVRRAADRTLPAACRAGRYAYVLSSRQMGKSSLLMRTRAELEAEGVAVATIDLTAIGTQGVDAETWYAGLLAEMESAFVLRTDLWLWWAEQGQRLSPVQRFVHFLRSVLVEEVAQHIVIVIDEIDSTLKLGFADDFYAALRALHNARAEQPALARLSFVLAGMATPTELIQDSQRTPFNIGVRIELGDFDAAEAGQLVARLPLEAAWQPSVTAAVLRWSGGQPFLTQRLCALLAEAPAPAGAAGIDAWVDGVARFHLLSEAGRADPHFQAIGRYMNETPAALKAALFAVYADVLRGRRVNCLDTSPVHNRLRLCGIVKRAGGDAEAGGTLVLRNALYREVFGPPWLRRHRPTFWTPANQRWTAALAASVLVSAGMALLWRDAVTARRSADLARSEAVGEREKAESAAADALAAFEAAAAHQALAAGQAELALDWAERALQRRRHALTLQTAFAVLDGLQTEAVLAPPENLPHATEALRLPDPGAATSAPAASADGAAEAAGAGPATAAASAPEPPGAAQAAAIRRTVSAVAWRADGRQLASVALDGHLRLWTLAGHGDAGPSLAADLAPSPSPSPSPAPAPAGPPGLLALAWAPAGDALFAAGQDGRIHRWTLGPDAPRALPPLEAHAGAVRALAMTPDGQLCASAGEDGRVRLWRRDDGALLHTLDGHRHWVRLLAISPDGRRLASAGNDGQLLLWSLPEGRLLARRAAHRDWVRALAFSPDGRVLASAGDDRTIRLWRGADGTPLRTLAGHRGAVRDAVFSPDGARLASVSGDGQTRLWQVADGRTLQAWPSRRGWLNRVRFVGPDRVLSAGDDGLAVLHTHRPAAPTADADEAGDDGTDLALTLAGHRAALLDLAVSPDGRRALTASADGSARLWWLQPGLRRAEIVNPAGAVDDLAWRDAGRELVAVGEGAWLRRARIGADGALEDLLAPPLPAPLPAPAERRSPGGGPRARVPAPELTTLALDPDGTLIAVAGKPADPARPQAPLWLLSGEHTLPAADETPRGTIEMLALCPQARCLAAAGEDDQVRLWWPQEPQRPPQTLHGHQGAVASVAVRPDGAQLASASADGSVRLWSLPDGAAAQVLVHDTQSRRLRTAVYSPDGLWLASAGDDGRIRLWQSADGQPGATIDAHDGPVMALRFSPDGQQLASIGQDRRARLWAVQDGRLRRPRPLAELDAAENDIGRSLAYSPDGQLLATGADDGRVRLWRARDGQRLGEFLLPDWIWTLAFSPDGRLLAAAGEDGRARVWRIAAFGESSSSAADPLASQLHERLRALGRR